MNAANMLPSLYLPHGAGPCFFMDWSMGPPDTWRRMGEWLSAYAATLKTAPRAILLISAHWEAAQFSVTAHPQPTLIYDYSGFPAHTYQLRYDVPGDPQLAQRVVELLAQASLKSASDPHRGLDHGVFIPLKLMFPQAQIPVVQLSLQTGLDPQQHLDAGRALAGLRAEGVLIIGSGMSWHNMRGFNSHYTQASEDFDGWLTAFVEQTDVAARNAALLHWTQAPLASTAHPRAEHLLPLMVVAGAADGQTGKRVFTDHVMDVQVSAYQFG